MIRIVFVAILMCLTCVDVSAQFRNIKIADAVAEVSGNNCTIAINPRNPLNVVAAAGNDNIYVSNDGGATWQSKKLVSPFSVLGNLSIMADSKGMFYCFHLSRPVGGSAGEEANTHMIVCQVSGDGGNTWDGGSPVGYVASKDQQTPKPTLDNKGNIYVTWTQFDQYRSDNSDCKSLVMLSSSSNGKKWSKPVQISNVGGDCVDSDDSLSGASAGVSDDRKIFVVWSAKNKLYLDRSFDGGTMWLSNDIEFADHPEGWSMEIPGVGTSNGMPVLAVDRGKNSTKGLMYVTWADQKNGIDDTDVWFMRSNSFGDYWTTPLKIGGAEKNTHQYLPAMVLDQLTGFIYILYYDQSGNEQNTTDVFLAWSKDAGTSFKILKLTESPFAPTTQPASGKTRPGNILGISAHKGLILPVWTRFEDDGSSSIWTAVIREDQLPK